MTFEPYPPETRPLVVRATIPGKPIGSSYSDTTNDPYKHITVDCLHHDEECVPPSA